MGTSSEPPRSARASRPGSLADSVRPLRSSPRASLASFSGEQSRRRLGVGVSAGGDRPLRAQLIVAFVVLLVLVAVPLYLFRRPSFKDAAKPGAATADAGVSPVLPTPRAEGLADAGAPQERVRVGNVQRIRCGASLKGGREGQLCDALPYFEETLARAIRENPDCAAGLKDAGSLNFVLNIDFHERKVHMFPGKSGDFRGKQARRVTDCVKRAISAPEWGSVTHQYRYYTIAILGTYQAARAVQIAPAPGAVTAKTPSFE